MDVRRSRIKLFGLVAFSALCAYGCDQLADGYTVPNKAWFASWIFTLTAIAATGFALFGNPLLARISPEGLLAPGICKDIIPWSDIQSISILKVYGSENVQVSLVPDSRSDRAISVTAAMLSTAGATQGIVGHSIGLGAANVGGEAFLEAVRAAQTAAPRKSNAGRVRTAGGGAGLQPSFGRRG